MIRGDTGGGNGCTLDRQGDLIMCEGADRRCITRMNRSGKVTTIADCWQGKRFHKPNDVICRSDGSIYFSDPSLRLEPALREMDIVGVFRIDPDGQIHLATDQCVYPNGPAFHPTRLLCMCPLAEQRKPTLSVKPTASSALTVASWPLMSRLTVHWGTAAFSSTWLLVSLVSPME